MALTSKLTDVIEKSEKFLKSGGTVKRFTNPSKEEIDSILIQLNSEMGEPEALVDYKKWFIKSQIQLALTTALGLNSPKIRVDVAYSPDEKIASVQMGYEYRTPEESFYWNDGLWSPQEGLGAGTCLRNLCNTYAAWAGLDFATSLYTQIPTSEEEVYKTGLTASVEIHKFIEERASNFTTYDGAHWLTVKREVLQQVLFEQRGTYATEETVPLMYELQGGYPNIPDNDRIYQYDESSKKWSPVS